ncbi:PaaI family thioesterase [Dongia sp.]|uniref:PaaI family thioesterase n=1 Tax=Dongia sp. TaxID=1977262 RepID=UPI0035AE5933
MERPYSGYAELIGYELIEKAKDFARLQLLLEPRHLNRMEVPHGGVIATLLDSATGFAVAYAGGPDRVIRAVTVSMNIQFMGQGKAGETIVAEGRRIGGGKTVAFATAEIRNEAGLILARGDAVYRFLEKWS